jgi:hypothetical protein
MSSTRRMLSLTIFIVKDFSIKSEQTAEGLRWKGSGSGRECGVGGGRAEATPGQAQGPEEDGSPEEKREAELKEDAEDEGDRRKNSADAFDQGVAEGERRASEVGLEGSAKVFHQKEVNVSLRNGGNEAFVFALSFGGNFAGLGDVFFEGDNVAKLASAFALELLKAGEISLRGGEMAFGGGEFYCGIFAGFGNGFGAAERFQVRDGRVEFLGGDGKSCSESAAGAGTSFGAQIFEVGLMSGDDAVKFRDGTIEGVGARAEVGSASDGRFPGKSGPRGVDG